MLPRGYLSWSAYHTFTRNREQYIRHYFYGEPGIRHTPSIQFGHTFAKHLDQKKKRKREVHPDPVVEMAIQAVPVLKSSEHKMEAKLPSKHGIIRLIGTLDDYDPKTHDFNEMKTGARRWTQGLAENHGQMKFYALMIWLNHNTVDEKKKLIWIQTERDGWEVRPTGKITEFPVRITLPQLLKFSRSVIDVAKEIHDLYVEEIKNATT